MKLIYILSVMVGSLSTQAIVLKPNWERPILRASLVELNEDGSKLDVIALGRASLTMNRRDGSRNATSLTFSEVVPMRCLNAPGFRCPSPIRTKNFRIVKQEAVGCGDVVISGVEKRSNFDLHHLPFVPPSEIELLDRRGHTCHDLIKYQWELYLSTHFSSETSEGVSVRHFGGNPTKVITIQ